MTHKKVIEIFDSTLRDGAQSEGISFSVKDKLYIMQALDEFGVDYIEAGIPGSNPKDAEFFSLAKHTHLETSKLCAFGATRRKGSTAENDAGLANLLSSGASYVSIFGKSHLRHSEAVLGVSGEENLDMVITTVEYLKKHLDEVIFDAEHFFDGFEYSPEYAMSVIDAAFSGGADSVTLCDTNGGTLPDRIAEITKIVTNKYPGRRIGIHTHDDCGLGAASAMFAINAGATLLQGTFLGIGERCGNCDLGIVIPNLEIKSGIKCGKSGVKLESLTKISRRIGEISGTHISSRKPYIGKSAFAHKGGMHIDAMEKMDGAYEHINPEYVGNKRRFLPSEVSGKATVSALAAHTLADRKLSSDEVELITKTLKNLEHEGYQFEAADASFELLCRKTVCDYKPHFNVIMFKTTDDFPSTDGKLQASAMVQIEVDGQTETSAALGNGPVNALDAALKRALTSFYPVLAEVTLTDFKVRVLEANSTTAAKVRVLIESTDSKKVWTTVGVSADIIEASLTALADAFEYKLAIIKKGENPNE